MENKPVVIPELKWIEKISTLLDSKFSLPGSKLKFGIDPVIGLIPVIGDLSTMMVSLMLLYTMAKHGGSKKLLLLMGLNILVDTTIGSIPIIGSIFDFGFKSNVKNVRLLKEHYLEGKHQGSGTGILLLILLFVLLIISLTIFLLIKTITFIIQLF